MKMSSFRLPAETIRQIKELAKRFGASQGRIVERAIDRLYYEEKKP